MFIDLLGFFKRVINGYKTSPLWVRRGLVVAVGLLLFFTLIYNAGYWLERRHDAKFAAEREREEVVRQDLITQAAAQETRLKELSSATDVLRQRLLIKDGEIRWAAEQLAEIAHLQTRLKEQYAKDKASLDAITDSVELERRLRRDLTDLGFDPGTP